MTPRSNKSFELRALASRCLAFIEGDDTCVITSVASLAHAGPSDISFFRQPRYTGASYTQELEQTHARAVLVTQDTPRPPANPTRSYLVVKDPSAAFQQLVELFLDDGVPVVTGEGIHKSACIDPTAVVEKSAVIGPFVVIEAHAHIGAFARIGAHSFIGRNVEIGAKTTLHPHVSIREYCSIGERCTLQSGVVIGSDGYGYLSSRDGIHTPLKQLGRVVLEDDVDVGANTCIDRARFEETRIGKGTKIDNLVQIGHGCQIGPHNLIVAQVGIAGSAKTGRAVVIGGQAGVNGHIAICDRVQIAGKSGVVSSIDSPGQYGGNPATDIAQFRRNMVLSTKLDALLQRVRKLEKSV